MLCCHMGSQLDGHILLLCQPAIVFLLLCLCYFMFIWRINSLSLYCNALYCVVPVVRPGDGYVQFTDRLHGVVSALQSGNTCAVRQLRLRRLRQNRRLPQRLQGTNPIIHCCCHVDQSVSSHGIRLRPHRHEL